MTRMYGGGTANLEGHSDEPWRLGNAPMRTDTFIVDPTDAEMKGKIIDNDPVTHPAHYTDGKIEVWDFIVDKKLNFLLGNVVKYVCRAGKKDQVKHIEDLKKARAYLQREIERVEDGE